MKSLQLPLHGPPSRARRRETEKDLFPASQGVPAVTSRRGGRGSQCRQTRRNPEGGGWAGGAVLSYSEKGLSLAPLCPRLGGGAPPAGHVFLIEDGSVGSPHSLSQWEGGKALLRSLGFGPRRGSARMGVTSLLPPLGVGARPLLRHQVAGAWASLAMLCRWAVGQWSSLLPNE